MARFGPTRALLARMRPAGEGPSEAERARSTARLILIGRAGDRRVTGEVRLTDPGYGSTAKMAAEAALCLALDRASLPERAGVLTPAAAMGERLLARLRAAGLTFEITGI
jgi:short subunit dehydrogenase-like uncharacterized protein